MNIDLLKNSLCENECAIILSPENRRYFTDFSSSDGVLAVTENNAVFYTDSRYIEAAKQRIICCDVREGKDQFRQLDGFFTENKINSVKTEASKITLLQYNNFRNNELMRKYNFEDNNGLDGIINSIRRTKSAEELTQIKKAQSIAEKAFDYILNHIAVGQTEKEIQLALDFYMLSHNSEALSFDTIVVSGKNSSMPHGIPSDKKIEKGDFITFDFGAVVNGYHSDMTRTIAVGYATEKMKEIYGIVSDAQTEVIKNIKAGLPCSDVDKIARDIISEAGYSEYFGHSLGHGVGIEIHEFPNLSPRSNEILKCGDVVTDEPGIYIPGNFGVRIEDMLYITENGCENLTKSPKNLIII